MVALLTHAEGLYLAMHNDYSVWIRVARDWQSGLTLYEQAPDNKLPPLFLFMRLIDGPRPEVSLYLAESFLAAVGGLALFAALRRTAPRSALPAALLLIAWTGTSGTFYGAQITEAISVWLDVIALCLCFYAVRRSRSLPALLAGALFFLMVTFRIPAVLHALAYLPLLVVCFRDWGAAKTARMVGAFVGGIVLALTLLLIHVRLANYWDPFVGNLVRNYRYGALHRMPLGESLKNCLVTIKGIVGRNPGFVILMAISLIMLLPKAWGTLRHERLWLWVSLLWLAGAVAGAFPGGRHFPHYYHVIWPPVAILSILWISAWGRSGMKRRGSKIEDRGLKRPAFDSRSSILNPRLLGWGLAFAFTALAVLHNGRGLFALARGEESLPRMEVREAADYLSRITSPNETVVVCVWDQWAELYWRVPLPAPTRCVAPQCFYGFQQELFDEWVQAMFANPPSLIVADGSLLGPTCLNSKYDNTEFRPPPGDPFYTLRQLVQDDYIEIHRIGDLCFLARRGGSHDPQFAPTVADRHSP